MLATFPDATSWPYFNPKTMYPTTSWPYFSPKTMFPSQHQIFYLLKLRMIFACIFINQSLFEKLKFIKVYWDVYLIIRTWNVEYVGNTTWEQRYCMYKKTSSFLEKNDSFNLDENFCQNYGSKTMGTWNFELHLLHWLLLSKDVFGRLTGTECTVRGVLYMPVYTWKLFIHANLSQKRCVDKKKWTVPSDTDMADKTTICLRGARNLNIKPGRFKFSYVFVFWT